MKPCLNKAGFVCFDREDKVEDYREDAKKAKVGHGTAGIES
ncbi:MULTISPECIES: hypothetical protein [Acidobacterium]|uniref:Uncharacterized protein n=1 Tax=Acidobacterium capsulatum (strain ATCC 51196 / DSM 11244 / BCRC 80197 / JCM 7670 / NBRC 15755 / NCIMB 13165 / 161) TaxID=240015 RepID=C1F128_ACIC5|nr:MULTISPECIES: hypothetical protein [Acidobacterium]ACO34426.1 hypothetical protein ACP_0529 [Acidobacterium capsulatum ATCC 51196]